MSVPALQAQLLASAFLLAVGPVLGAPPVESTPGISAPAGAGLPFSRSTGLDKGDEEAQFIAGLAKRGLHEMVVRESRDFLRRRVAHKRASTVRYRMADALFELGNTAEALTEYKALDQVAGFEQATEVKFRLGQCLLDLGQNAEAAAAFRGAVSGNAEYLKAASSYLLGEALFRIEDWTGAREAYAGVFRATEGVAEYARDARYGVTWSAWKGGDYDATVAGAEAFLANHKDDSLVGEIAFLSAEAHLAAKRPVKALAAYARVTGGDYLETARRGAAFAEAARGNHRKAAELFRAYRSQFPSGQFVAEATLQEGVQLVRAEDFGGAVQALTARSAADDAQTRYWRALAYAGAGNHQEALKAAQQGLTKNPDEAMAAQLRIAAGDALFELGRADEAAELYESSGSAYALHAAAVARLNAGDAKEAERLARTLLTGVAREPGAAYRADALLTRGEALFRLKRYEEAEPLLQRLLSEAKPGPNGTPAVTPAKPEIISRAGGRLAWCRWYAGDHQGAKGLFVSLAKDSNGTLPERQEAAFMAGRAALAAEENEAAASWFDSYLKAAPKGPFAAEALLRLARLQGGDGAAALFMRIAAEFPDSELVAPALSELAEIRIGNKDMAGAAEAYAALVEKFPTDELAKNATYGLGWARYNLGDLDGAAGPLWKVAVDKDAPAELQVASTELLVWVEAAAKRPAESMRAFMGLTRLVKDEGRLVTAARVVDGAFVEASDLKGRTMLWNRVFGLVKGVDAVSAARIERGFLALDKGDVETAAKEALAARQAAPTSPAVAELLFFVGETYFKAEDDRRAAPLFLAASAHGAPEVAERALYKAGFSELRSGNNEDAIKAFAAVAERFGNGVLAPESMFLAGEASYRDGKDADAVKWLRRMLKEAPGHASRAKALFRLGVAEGRLENWRPSADALAELIAKNPEFPSLLEAELWRGRALSRVNERRAARQSLSRVVEKDQGVLAAQARIELGRLHEIEKDDESAISEYLKVAVLYGHAEECAESLVRAGDVLARQGKADRAKAQYEEAIADYPKTPWADEARVRLGLKRLGGSDTGGKDKGNGGTGR